MNFKSYTTDGWDGDLIDIEISILPRSLPGIEIVGLPGCAIKESRVRVRSAILKSGYDFPKGRIILNMAPAGKRKDGAMFDLPFACSIVLANNKIADDYMILGELTLDGRIRGIQGVLPAIVKGKEKGICKFIIPSANLEEASILKYGDLYPVDNLKGAVEVLSGKIKPSKYSVIKEEDRYYENFSDVLHQDNAIRGVEIAISGGHNLLLFGPPGVGKSMILNRINGVLPKLSRDQSIETSMIWSISDKNITNPLISEPPVRKPHHGASVESIIGERESNNVSNTKVYFLCTM